MKLFMKSHYEKEAREVKSKKIPSQRGAKGEGNETMKMLPKKTVVDIIKEHYTRQDQRNYKGKTCLLMEAWTTYEVGDEIPRDGEVSIDLEQRPVN